MSVEQHEDKARRGPRVIAVSSGKGGVGKTFLSVHLAAQAAGKGLRTLLLDANLGLANVDVMLGVAPQATINDVIQGSAKMETIIASTRHGFDVIPGGCGLSELTVLDANHQRLVLDELETLADHYDLVLIDTAAGIGENVLYFTSSSQSVLLTLAAEPTSLTTTYALIKVLSRERHVRRFMVAINQADQEEAAFAFHRLQSVCDHYLHVYLDYVGHIPSSPEIGRCIQGQRLLFERTEADPARTGLTKLVDAVLDRPATPGASGNLQFFWQHNLSAGLPASVQAGAGL
ncbi:MAG: MinD/ParA family protein [Mariprofundaceae bacterium]